MASRNLLVSDEEMYNKMCRQNCFLCVDLMKKNTAFRKITFIFLRFGGNVYQRASIDRPKKDEGSEGKSGSWRSWSSTGTVLMVGGLVLSSEREKVERSEANCETDKGDFQVKRNWKKKRSGHRRTQGIREWRAKRKLEFEENDPTAMLIPVKTRASKVRVHFDADSFLERVFDAQF